MIISLKDLEDEREPTPEEIANRKLYESNQELRKVADEIHKARLLSPPACDDCIALAIRRLRSKEKP